MQLKFDINLASNYKSNSQIARVLTESWLKENSYCPNCGKENLENYANNRPVADFYCANCFEEFELKSKNGSLGRKITDGAYATMIERINSTDNPNFFFLTYHKIDLSVNNFLIIPKQFFQSEIIEKRPPLAETARRAGWIGCNIDLTKIPQIGRIFLVKDSKVADKTEVLETWNKTIALRNKSVEAKGWTLDVLRCVDQINSNEFSLDEVYKFEDSLKFKHPDNNFVKDKIRQQLQILRDMDIIEFVSRGKYRKVSR
ncbi:MAG TPA: DpnI domain-containing protein [Pyrinomonadaceae bacterium]|nr:DpnI domain-containing protein [Pyrinomonadaceae bacterium]